MTLSPAVWGQLTKGPGLPACDSCPQSPPAALTHLQEPSRAPLDGGGGLPRARLWELSSSFLHTPSGKNSRLLQGIRPWTQLLSRVRLFVILRTVACQAPVHGIFLGKNPGVGCHFLLQGIFLTQGSNLHVLHLRQNLIPPSHPGSPFLKGNK